MPCFAGRSFKDEETTPYNAFRETDCGGHPSLHRTRTLRMDLFHEAFHANLGGHRFPGERPGRLGGVARLKLLLDTHIWLWTLHDPRQLGRRLLHELRN